LEPGILPQHFYADNSTKEEQEVTTFKVVEYRTIFMVAVGGSLMQCTGCSYNMLN